VQAEAETSAGKNYELADLMAPYKEGKETNRNTNAWGETNVTEDLGNGMTVFKTYSDTGLLRSDSLTQANGVQISRSFLPSGALEYVWQVHQDGTSSSFQFDDAGSITWRNDHLGSGIAIGYKYENGRITEKWLFQNNTATQLAL
jgi:hypothetical protein